MDIKDRSLVSLPVRRPVLTAVTFLVILVIGFFSLTRLPIDYMPEITMPAVTVVTTYDGAGPLEVEELITRPIESALSALQGIEEITSTSTEGRSTVRVMFPWGTDQEAAVNDMRDRIDRVMSVLPEGVDRPLIRKFDMSAVSIINIAFMGEGKDLSELQQIIEDQIQYRLERIPGVASIDARGGRRKQVQVALKAVSMEAYGISTDMAVSALRRENNNIPAGSLIAGNRDVMIRTLAEYNSIEDIKGTVVTVAGGVPIRIADIAEVFDGYEDASVYVRVNGQPSIRLAIGKQSGSNTVAVANAVRREMRRIKQDFPALEMEVVIDNAQYVERAIKTVTQSLLLGGAIAIFILMMFLRNISTTVIISVAIPISIVATFALVYFAGFTLNMMTFGGLALGIGMLLDNAIVVLDNIYYKREHGIDAKEAAVKGVSEVFSAVLASTITTLVVFIPVIFMRGMTGIMFMSLAFVIGFSIACSLLVAVTLVPMLSSRYLSTKSMDRSGNSPIDRAFRASENFYIKIEKRYRRILRWSLRNRATVVVFVAMFFGLALYALPMVGVELSPSTDESDVRVSIEMEVGTKLDRVRDITMQVEEIVRREVPEAKFIISFMGGTGGFGASGANNATVRAALVPVKERKRSSAQVAEDLRKALRGIPGATIRVREGQSMMTRITSSDEAINIEVRGYGLQTGQEIAQKINDAVKEVRGVTDVTISREAGMPEYRVRIDRNKAAELGLTAAQIGATVQTAMAGTASTKIRIDGKEYNILVRLAEDDRRGLNNLNNLSVLNRAGQPVNLQAAAWVESGVGPTRVERRDRERVVNVRLNYAGRDMGSIVADLREVIKDIYIPQEFVVLIRGDWEEQQKSQREMVFAIVMAVVLIFLVMAGQFESFKDPFVVLFSIPVSLIGVVAIMLATKTPFTLQAFIGCIILVGIVINNAIVLVDLVNRLRHEENIELFQALEMAGERRLRPILMTSLTTCLGLVPMAIGLGEGSEAQVPMARVVIGGLFVSTIITLVLIPVVYSLIEQKIGKKKEISEGVV
ncbi:MAG: efflux RND transporter permease subunit [Chitinispirillales bacterium]|jgi:HAE1 family hydrophobic/amphiphilic exporter-1|nr:efflux RND transporter permease subunit [Chitinispirillales bacterium]